MNRFYADFHIHIGRTTSGRPVKITGARSLTLENIIRESTEIKGLNMIGIIDCHVPEVIDEFEALIEDGTVVPQEEGGLRFKDVAVIPGSEIEIYDDYSRGAFHVLVFFPDLYKMKQFSAWLSGHMKNITLSSQRYYGTGKSLQEKTKELGGLFIVAHAFTPHKGLYGSGVERRLTEVLDPDKIDAIELGLSANTEMADQIPELHRYPYLSNSDAHSLPKMAREYQTIEMEKPTFHEFQMALREEKGRKITANYGLDPRLGKYHRTMCENCYEVIEDTAARVCPHCGNRRITRGVYDRLQELREESREYPERPPYVHQVPLEFIPKLGPKTLMKLRDHFKTDMAILHEVPEEALKEVVSEQLADYILQARYGKLSIRIGGAGRYGKVN
ncbi:MAG TPA: endonuclease Q family protein [Bacillales bacterium]|nr:endonuclease Q family protein [Bacillales bacterium]